MQVSKVAHMFLTVMPLNFIEDLLIISRQFSVASVAVVTEYQKE